MGTAQIGLRSIMNSAERTNGEYEGKDLEVMAYAHRYASWIVQELRPFLGKRILEVGAGIGSMSRIFLDMEPELLISLEPSARMFSRLQAELYGSWATEIVVMNSRLATSKAKIREAGIDSAIYVNVLEHIENDDEELATVFEVLQPGGTVGLYVPALPSLYGPFDERVGHFRRYRKDSLVELVENAGFDVIFARYCDVAGVVPWWINSKLLRSDNLSPTSVKLYDTLVPVVRGIDRIFGPPIGRNVIVCGRKPV